MHIRVLGLAAAFVTFSTSQGRLTAQTQTLKTVAESSNYTATATEAEVRAYLEELTSQWPVASLQTIGDTVEGRPLWAVVCEPTIRSIDRPVTVLVLGGIHSGECDGKEAILALARDLRDNKQGDWWKSLRLIFVPNYNADGNERRSEHHRLHQEGPAEGMGVRENAQSLDLNRDFVKLESPESQALIGALNNFDVDILIDTHTTNGSLHQHDLTYDIPHNPAAPKNLDRWLRTDLMPTVTDRLKEQGILTFYYGNFNANHTEWTTYGHIPRYSTEYMGLRGKIGILSESYSYKSYQRRIEASYNFVLELLRRTAEQEQVVREQIDEATAQIDSAVFPIQARLATTAERIPIPGYVASDGSLPKRPFNAQKIRESQKRDHFVRFVNRAEPTKSVTLPSAYVIPRDYSWAISRLMMHGIGVKRLQQSQTVDAEHYIVKSLKRASLFQGHRNLVIETEVESGSVRLNANAFVVECNQPLTELTAYLLEPESEDSLVAWNFFDPDIQPGKTIPIYRVMGPLDSLVTTPVTEVIAGESLTLSKLFKPGQTVDYSGDKPATTRWIEDSLEYVVQKGQRQLAIDAETGATRGLKELEQLRASLAALDAFSTDEARNAAKIEVFSPDLSRALLSHKNDLYFFKADTNTTKRLTNSQKKQERLAELNPAGTHVAFVRDNNLWIANCDSLETTQLTNDGTVEMLNGILDWVYQEELYGRGNFKGFWWSDDGQKLAYLKLDQTPVHHYVVNDSISYRSKYEDTRYPKAGDPLPSANVIIVDIAKRSSTAVDLSSFPSDDRLIGRVTWSPSNELWLQVFNRVQNRQDLLRVDPTNGNTKTVFHESSPGWCEIRGTPHFLADGNFLWLSDLPHGRTHLFQVDAQTGMRTQLTSGKWDVDELHAVSTDEREAFVTGNISHPTEQQLVAVSLKDGTSRQITTELGTHRVSLDPSG